MRLPLRAAGTIAAVTCAVAGLTAGPGLAAPPSAPGCGPSYANPLTAMPWPLRRLNPSTAWPLSRGAGVTVAVIDSGVSTTHPKLAGQVLPGMDFIHPGQPGTCDDDGHGTVVAGIIAARDGTERGTPFYGVAPDAKILPIRVLPNSQKTDDQRLPGRIADAIRWATDSGAKVINLSLTTPPTQSLADAVTYAQSKDVVLVAAAGNEGGTAFGNSALYPAAYPGVVGVAGIGKDGKHVATSNKGSDVAVSAPGVYIEGPAPQGGGYVVEKQGGTSFAAAYVSGVAALVRAYNPSLDAQAVIRRIRLTADPAPYARDVEFGDGVVNPYRAVSAVFDPGTSSLVRSDTPLQPLVVADPLAGVKRAALWIAPAGVLVAVLLPLLAALMRRGRGEDEVAVGPVATTVRLRDDFVPLIGQRLIIGSPSVQRAGGAGSGLPGPAAPPGLALQRRV